MTYHTHLFLVKLVWVCVELLRKLQFFQDYMKIEWEEDIESKILTHTESLMYVHQLKMTEIGTILKAQVLSG